MTSIDLTPLYRSSIGYDRLGRLIDSALRTGDQSQGYPPYNIEVLDDNHYALTLAVAGFDEAELAIEVENGQLTISGKKASREGKAQYLHQGIAQRAFERKYNLAEHVEVSDAKLNNGLLTVNLIREIPEAKKPKQIAIKSTATQALEQASHSAERAA